MVQLGFQLETMTGIDLVTAAESVAEIEDIHRFATPDKLARFAGIAPIAVGSGNKHRNYKCKQGNRELHDIIKVLAIRQIAVTGRSENHAIRTSMRTTSEGWRRGRRNSKPSFASCGNW
jgi:transposase